jgi:DNA processing protein
MARPDVAYLVGLSLLPGIGPARFARLLERFPEPERAWRASEPELAALGVDATVMPTLLARRRELDLDAELEKLRRHEVQVLSLHDPEYPPRLREIGGPPGLLYVKGRLAREDDQAIGVVGTRSPSVYGKDLTARTVPELARAGLTVVSGLARGIDAVAHQTALEAGGRTIAVLGCGVDVIYPAEHRRLFERIQRQGAVISEYPLGAKPDAFNFPARNRIIAGLSIGVVVVEANVRSGALITADYALEQNREIFAFPGRTTDRGSAGCNKLIRDGRAKLVTCTEDIFAELDLSLAVQQLEIKVAIPANDEEGTLLALLSHEPTHIDDLVRQAALAAPTVASTLMMLELKGSVRQVGMMSYVLAS